MTNEGAKMLLQVGFDKHIHNGTYDEAIKMGIEALSKQEVKPPVDGFCSCGNIIGRSAVYCKKCGQKVREG